MTTEQREKPVCPHCKHEYGYLIDGVFHPVKWCGHKINGEVWIFEPGKAPRKRDDKKRIYR